jgi:hypothetical protein
MDYLRAFATGLADYLERDRTWTIGLVLGAMVCLFYAAPYLLQGGGAIVETHDNLDSDVVWFQQVADSPHTSSFSNEVTIESVMGGRVPRNAFPPSLNGVTALFVLFGPLTAYLANFFLVRAVGVISMYVFLRRCVLTESQEAVYAIPVALAFGLLPYHGVHPGIAISGLPLVAIVFANAYTGEYGYGDAVLLVFYGLYSSLVYVGMFVLLIVGGGTLVQFLRGKLSLAAVGRLVGGSVILGSIYLLAEGHLIRLILSDFVSHREEFNPIQLGNTTDLLGTFVKGAEHFVSGHYHAPSYHTPFFLTGVLGAIGLGETCRRTTGLSDRQTTHFRWLAGLLILLIAISGLYGLWRWEPLVSARMGGGILSKVQFDRFYWLVPFLWTFAFAIGVALVRRLSKPLRPVAFALAALQLVFVVGANGELRANYQQMIGRDIPTPTYNEFYSPDLFETVQEEIGRPPSSYRVVSVGLHPDVAAYNGFHTLDGYQRLYPLAYKHKFRRIIASELEKSDELRRYFDHWGSRCYIFSADIGKDVFIPKTEATPIRLDINTAALRELGGEYVLSAVPLANASALGLTLVHTAENATSPYRLHVYRTRAAFPPSARTGGDSATERSTTGRGPEVSAPPTSP